MTKKLLLVTTTLIFLINQNFAQCTIEKWSLQKRIDLSQLVVEGKVIDQYAFRPTGKNTIYTASVIEVYKLFKGKLNSPQYIEIITFGGRIGLEMHKADPELELQKDDIGLFLLVNNQVDIPEHLNKNGKDKFQGTANVQSFLAYDFSENAVYDYSEIITGINKVFYPLVQSYTNQNIEEIKFNGFNPDKIKIRPLAGPTISTFTSNANAGTDDILTIKGTGFGKVRGNGRVEFLDANYGDGRRVKTPYPEDYTLWNDTQIKVRVPGRAGTGTLRLATNDSLNTTSKDTFKVNYSHLNASFQPSGSYERFYTTDHRSDNGKGGYTFQFNPRFKANSGMVNAFLRSMETWRCGTLINWDIGRDTNIKVIDGDQVNIVKLTKFTDSKLAVCYSYWNGCFISGANMEWFVNELDIEADSSRKWYYGTGTPANNEFDFQSVLSHELGHGHQLGHVIASKEMMHYSIGPGQKKATLSANDLAGGNYVKDKSIKNNACSGTAMTALTAGNCGYTLPLPGFRSSATSICPGKSVTFTDTSKGIVKNYSWSFGSGASPSSASGKGPHTVTYTSSGVKTIKQFVSNDFGTDSLIKVAYLNVLLSKPAAPTNLIYSDTACLAATNISVDSFSSENTLVWQMPPQSSTLSTSKFGIRISWTSAGGPYQFKVKLSNQCGSSDSLIGKVVVLSNPTSSFTAVENGRTVTFTNASTNASNYKWYFGDGDSSSQVNPVHQYPLGKAYTATLRAINRCKFIPFSKTVNPFHPSSVDQIIESDLLAFPNPTLDVIYLSNQISHYSISDLSGKVLIIGIEKKVNLINYKPGVYILNAVKEDGMAVSIKIVKL